MKSSGNTILITGGGSGIGLALAKKFLAHDNTVIITGRNLSKLKKVQTEHSALHIAQSDVTDVASIKAVVERCQKEFGGIDVLVNNAGVFHAFDISDENYPFEKQEQEVDIDFMGPIRMVHHFMPVLKQRPEAAIINVSSALAFIPLSMAPVYSATKAGVHAWTQSLRKQLEAHKSNIKVMELMPPVVDTEMVADLSDDFPKISPEKLASDFWKGYLNNKAEITPGQSSQLKLMRRLAPGFIFNAVNKQALPSS